jgi:Calcineurin-like phosphoesterase
MKTRLAANLAALVCVYACSGSPATPSAPARPGAAASAAAGPPAVFVGAGDIADCNRPGSELTAKLLDAIGGTVFTTGDNAYPNASAAAFRDCYGPTWGRHRGRTRPTPGNHEYESPNASPYYDYFGSNAGPAGLGYYSFNLGPWHVISLNSEAPASAGTPQERWLRDDLTANQAQCTLAYWHRPLFSSGPHGVNPDMQALWRTLYEFGADVVLGGHDHLYERFAPQDPDGRADPARGIRQFVIGTGGAPSYQSRFARPNSEAQGTDMGVLALTLAAGSYRWEFVPVEGATFRDSGTGACH